MVRFFTYSQFHAKRNIGSTKIRVDNLLKYWPEAGLYKYGQNPDVMIFQKVFVTLDYKFIQHFEGIKILDICDPEWKDTPDIFIKETLDVVDAVVASSQTFVDYLQQMTKTRCLEIKDRFDMTEFPEPKKHFSQASKVAWFGYTQNADALKFAIPSLELRGLDLLVISNDDPACWRWANSPREYKKKYKYLKYTDDLTVRQQLQAADMVIFPRQVRPLDKFKSENKTVVAELCGLPVVRNSDELDKMMSGIEREKYIKSVYNKLKRDYRVELSVKEYKKLINEINQTKLRNYSEKKA